MSREREFHKLIESQDADKKKAAWERLKSRIDFDTQESEVEVQNGFSLALAKHKNVVWTVSVFAVVLLVALSIFLGIWLKRDKGGPLSRYCTEDDYYIEEATINAKEYSEQINKEWLFFDWYIETDHLEDYFYKLNDTDEVICFREDITDIETGYTIFMYITDNYTEINTLSIFKEMCVNIEQIGITKVNWIVNGHIAYAKFEYNSYVYYLQISDAENENVILEYVRLLLN